MRVAAFLLVIATFALSACNTVAGVGKDVERAGEAIQKSTR
ncbi:MAG TPA: entericidin A/B family lipoprotein [Burkholderiales bacterium]|nr:entericidin A/B family lipoprotein [Burkholderiales bacterium]